MTSSHDGPKPKKLFDFKLVLLGGLILVVSYSVFDRSIPVEVRQLSITDAKPGQDAIELISVNRLRTCETKVSRTLYDSSGTKFYISGISYQLIGEVGEDTYKIRLPIDKSATPGKGFVRLATSWICNYTHLLWPVTQLTDVPITIEEP